jgi:hypothetical protein
LTHVRLFFLPFPGVGVFRQPLNQPQIDTRTGLMLTGQKSIEMHLPIITAVIHINLEVIMKK